MSEIYWSHVTCLEGFRGMYLVTWYWLVHKGSHPMEMNARTILGRTVFRGGYDETVCWFHFIVVFGNDTFGTMPLDFFFVFVFFLVVLRLQLRTS